MENNELENDTLNNEEEQDLNLEDGSEEDSGEELVKIKEAYENQKVRAEKAEKELKKLQAERETPKNDVEKSEAPKKEETSDEPDLKSKYEKLALKTEGITHPDDQKVVLDEAKRLNLDVEEVMAMEHIQSKLKANKNQRDAGDAMPDGKGKSGGDFKGQVEYWVDRKNPDGTYQTPEDPELAEKVIDARVNQQKNQAQFEPIRV